MSPDPETEQQTITPEEVGTMEPAAPPDSDPALSNDPISVDEDPDATQPITEPATQPQEEPAPVIDANEQTLLLNLARYLRTFVQHEQTQRDTDTLIARMEGGDLAAFIKLRRRLVLTLPDVAAIYRESGIP